MSFRDFTPFEQLKEVLNEGGSVPDLQIKLNALAIWFAEISDEYRVLDDEEQKVRECEYLQLQYQYHEIAMVMITKLLDPMFIDNGEPHSMEMSDEQPEELTKELLVEEQPPSFMESSNSETSNA